MCKILGKIVAVFSIYSAWVGLNSNAKRRINYTSLLRITTWLHNRFIKEVLYAYKSFNVPVHLS